MFIKEKYTVFKNKHRQGMRVSTECVLMIVVCIAIRVLTIIDLPFYRRADVRDYVSMALNYNVIGTMQCDYDDLIPFNGETLVNHRPPLYPWVLSQVFDHDDLSGTIFRARVINIASDCLVVLALYIAFACGGFSVWAARIASLSVCLNAGWDVHFLTEPLFTALFALGVCCAFLKRNVILSGLVVGAAILCRSVAVLLPLLYIARNFRRGIYVALIAAVFPVAWGVRNYVEFGYFEPFTCNRQFHKVASLTDFGVSSDELMIAINKAYTSTPNEFEAERALEHFKLNHSRTRQTSRGHLPG